MPRRTLTSVADALELARRRVPPAIFQQFVNGAGDLDTHDRNVQALRDVLFRPRHGVFHPRRDLGTTVLGHELRVPLVASSIGALGLAHPDGESGVARAIGDAGGLQFVSAVTSQPIERIMAAATGPVYFQPYFFGAGREGVEATIERVRAAGCDGLVFLIDSVCGHTPTRALTLRERRFTPSGTSRRDVIGFAPQLITRPRWSWAYLRGQVSTQTPMALAADGCSLPLNWVRRHLYDQWFDWADLDWIRELWDGPIVVKGALSVDDARRAVAAGATGVVVSNHGGNRLDGTIPALPVLPEVVAAVGDEIDVLFDSGVRTGPDVVRALALGAKAVGLGRAYLYPLMAAGEAGVRAILQILRRDIDATLAYLGCERLDELSPDHLEIAWSSSRNRSSAGSPVPAR
jgi:isopentenyl diphosphate isomerase/L-lactate dehydrogenase-like FMN-dependent dehydrogenase